MGKVGFLVSKLKEDPWMIQSYRALGRRCPPYLTTWLKLSSVRYNFICFTLVILHTYIYYCLLYLKYKNSYFKEDCVVLHLRWETERGHFHVDPSYSDKQNRSNTEDVEARMTWNMKQTTPIYLNLQVGIAFKVLDDKRERDQSPVLQMTTWYKLFRIGRATNCNGTFSPL